MPMVMVNDIHLYYEIHGKGEPICIIPGLRNDVTDYSRIIRLFSKKYQVIAFDNRGAGRTDKPDIPYSISMMAEDVAQLLTCLEIGPVHILGVSMGGRIATELTLQHPEKVKSLILVSTYVHRIDQDQSSRLLDLLLRIPMLERLGGENPQPRYAVNRQRHASRDYDATERLQMIDVPTLILHGKKDRFAPYPFAEEMHRKIRNSTLVSFGGGHLFLFIKSEQFVDAVIQFLEGGSRKD